MQLSETEEPLRVTAYFMLKWDVPVEEQVEFLRHLLIL